MEKGASGRLSLFLSTSFLVPLWLFEPDDSKEELRKHLPQVLGRCTLVDVRLSPVAAAVADPYLWQCI
jgi:hypothetical protein